MDLGSCQFKVLTKVTLAVSAFKKPSTHLQDEQQLAELRIFTFPSSLKAKARAYGSGPQPHERPLSCLLILVKLNTLLPPFGSSCSSATVGAGHVRPFQFESTRAIEL